MENAYLELPIWNTLPEHLSRVLNLEHSSGTHFQYGTCDLEPGSRSQQLKYPNYEDSQYQLNPDSFNEASLRAWTRADNFIAVT